MVGAKGFEPSTSWSRTKDNQSHKRFSWRRLRDQDHCFPSCTCTPVVSIDSNGDRWMVAKTRNFSETRKCPSLIWKARLRSNKEGKSYKVFAERRL